MFRSRIAILFAVATLSLTTSVSALAQAPAQPAPSSPPASAEPPPPPPPTRPPAVQRADPFGEEVTLAAKTMIVRKGTATWDKAYETLIEAFKQVRSYLDKAGLKADGPAMTIYTSTDDRGFQYVAGFPVTEAPKNPPRGDLAVTQLPDGKALKFVHRGSYDAMDTTYEAITNHLDERRLEAKDMFVEEYTTDPLTTAEDKLVINVFVPLKPPPTP